MLFGRGFDYFFDGCYVVLYGRFNIEFFFLDSDVLNKNKFEFFYEGVGFVEYFCFNMGGLMRIIGYIIFKIYNMYLCDNIIVVFDGLMWWGGEVVVINNLCGNLNMFNNLLNFMLYGVDIVDGFDIVVSVVGFVVWLGDYWRVDGINYIIDFFVSVLILFYFFIDKIIDVGLINWCVRVGYF